MRVSTVLTVLNVTIAVPSGLCVVKLKYAISWSPSTIQPNRSVWPIHPGHCGSKFNVFGLTSVLARRIADVCRSRRGFRCLEDALKAISQSGRLACHGVGDNAYFENHFRSQQPGTRQSPRAAPIWWYTAEAAPVAYTESQLVGCRGM